MRTSFVNGPKGLYALTVEATEVSDPTKPASSATATITLV
jgi:hypothetical protein